MEFRHAVIIVIVLAGLLIIGAAVGLAVGGQ